MKCDEQLVNVPIEQMFGQPFVWIYFFPDFYPPAACQKIIRVVIKGECHKKCEYKLAGKDSKFYWSTLVQHNPKTKKYV